ncbi:unnamed protein product [Euphydryas editha]|uniref:Uncharacterized protein n=1 Tax=Euphydryas editha TaxID=104508 RepID=A0AAU9U995_EUPED|nr:unnamed protein product [Euphydryas editha]
MVTGSIPTQDIFTLVSLHTALGRALQADGPDYYDKKIITIVTLARPSPPRNCTAKRIMKDDVAYLTVRCVAGYDGGLSQHFVLEVVGESSRILVNTTAMKPDFHTVWLNVSWSELEDLSEDEMLTVSARNSKGVSDPILIRDLVYKDAAKHIEDTTRPMSKFPAAAAIAGAAAIFTASVVILVLILRKRKETTTNSKRPSQSVVQVDANGRRYLIAYPASEKLERKPDILNPKAESEPPRVVLESSDSKTYTIKEAVSQPAPYPHPSSKEDMVCHVS